MAQRHAPASKNRPSKASKRARFDIAVLRACAGPRSFERGESYFRSGRVRILAVEPGRVLATVAGSEEYRTEVTGQGKTLGGECSCPAFDESGFCKHMVAAALAANETGSDANGVSPLARIREHLKLQGVDALVSMVLSLAERDSALFRRLDLAATMAGGDDDDLRKQLRRAIDEATHPSEYVDYREAAAWADDVRSALDSIHALLSAGRAKLALELAAHALHRIEQALESVDDSDGYGMSLLDRASDIHLAAASAARPEPVAFAREVFNRDVSDGCGTLHNAVASYADVLGAKGMVEYRRLAQAAWDKLPARVGTLQRGNISDGNYNRLAGILDFFAERDGDIDTRIALRSKDLSSPWNYLKLAEFCGTQGRPEQALRWAEEGAWMFEDGPDERLVGLLVDLLIGAGRKTDAERQLWQAFEKGPSLPIYTRLRKLGGAGARDRALRFLEARLAAEKGAWGYAADFLVGLLIHEKMFKAAWAIVRKHGASETIKCELARASEASHPREALATYRERVNWLVGSSLYPEAVQLISRMTGLHSASEHAAYITDIKLRFGRRRNFMKLLL